MSKRSLDRSDAKFRVSPVTKWYVHLFYPASPSRKHPVPDDRRDARVPMKPEVLDPWAMQNDRRYTRKKVR